MKQAPIDGFERDGAQEAADFRTAIEQLNKYDKDYTRAVSFTAKTTGKRLDNKPRLQRAQWCSVDEAVLSYHLRVSSLMMADFADNDDARDVVMRRACYAIYLVSGNPWQDYDEYIKTVNLKTCLAEELASRKTSFVSRCSKSAIEELPNKSED